MKMSLITSVLFSTALFSSPAFAFEPLNAFSGNVGVNAEYSRMGNSGMNLDDRTMSAVMIEALPGYRWDQKWLAGLHVSYKWQQQVTSIADAGGTNLAGTSWTVGAGAQYLYNPKWAFQGTLDFLGRYKFAQKTDVGQEDHLESPINISLKAQYFFPEKAPWSLDFGVGYDYWREFYIESTSHSEGTQQLKAFVGISYHWKVESTSSPSESTEPAQASAEPSPTPAETPQDLATSQVNEPPANVAPETPIEPTVETVFFELGKSKISGADRKSICHATPIWKSRSKKVQLTGHADATGPEQLNIKLSKRRADSVKNVFVQCGYPAKQITTEGVGSSQPIADNETAEGRQKNRRVEVSAP
jgi:outer membrane protein OmpA-like peptidoglycan-associated protein